jgi:hypothetical protein
MPVTISGNGTFTGTSFTANNIANGAITANAIANSAVGYVHLGYDGTPIQIVSVYSGSEINHTIAYNSVSNSPIQSRSITARKANSNFLVIFSSNMGQLGAYRSQILLSRNYTSGSAIDNGQYIWYDHYGMYVSSAINAWLPGGFTYLDSDKTLAAGSSRTYSVHAGTIGGGQQRFNQLSLTVIEIAG